MKTLDLNALESDREGAIPDLDYEVVAVNPEPAPDGHQRYGSVLVRAGGVHLALSGIDPEGLAAGDRWRPDPRALFVVIGRVAAAGMSVPHLAQDPVTRATYPPGAAPKPATDFGGWPS